MLALYINHSTPIRVKSCLAPRSSRAAPSNLSVPCTTVKPKSVSSDGDAHLALFAEAVRREAVHTGADETDWNECVG